MTHKGTQTLTTPRLTLRRFYETDAEQMYENWAKDPQVTRFLTWDPHESPAGTRQLLTEWCTNYEQPDYYNWVILLEGQAVGNISVVRSSDAHEQMELGYCLGHAFWNRGIMTEAVQAVTDFLFEQVGAHRLEIWHATGNPASGKVAQKCGFTFEGVRRQAWKQGDVFWDLATYAILREEWKK